MKKIVLVGVFKPIKDSPCRVSMLNFANLNIDMKGMNNAKNGMYFKLLSKELVIL